MQNLSGLGKVVTGFVTGKEDLKAKAEGTISKTLASAMSQIPRFTAKAENSATYRFANAAWGASTVIGGTALCVACPVIIPCAIAGCLIKHFQNNKTENPSQKTISQPQTSKAETSKTESQSKVSTPKENSQQDLSKLSDESLSRLDTSKLSDKQMSSLSSFVFSKLSPEQTKQLDLTKLPEKTLYSFSESTLKEKCTLGQMKDFMTKIESSYKPDGTMLTQSKEDKKYLEEASQAHYTGGSDGPKHFHSHPLANISSDIKETFESTIQSLEKNHMESAASTPSHIAEETKTEAEHPTQTASHVEEKVAEEPQAKTTAHVEEKATEEPATPQKTEAHEKAEESKISKEHEQPTITKEEAQHFEAINDAHEHFSNMSLEEMNSVDRSKLTDEQRQIFDDVRLDKMMG